MFRRILAISKKELRQLKRDIRMMMVLFFFPIALLVIFGYAINFDVHNIKTAVYDRSKSQLSRDFISSLSSSDYFDIVDYLNNDDEIKEALDNGTAQCVLVFPEDLERNLYSKKEAKIQILIDGVNGNTATIIMNYLNSAVRNYSNKFSSEIIAVSGKKSFTPIELEPVFWFNPELKSTTFLIPGLIAMILIITAVISIALSIVKEKELGTVEQLNVSPVTPMELIIGKTLPFAIISLLIAALILFSGNILFGVTIKGSPLLLLLTTLLFILSSLSLGVFVSTIAETQQIAFQIASLSTMLPSVILSGFIFPIESMPDFIQILTNITPAKFFMVILRNILIKGAGLPSFWTQVIYLMIFTSFFLTVATLRYKKSVEA